MSSVLDKQPADSFRTPLTILEDAIIPSDSDTSNAVDLGGASLGALEFPSAMTGSSVSFLVSNDGTNYVPYYYEGALFTVTATVSTMQGINALKMISAKLIKLKSNGTEGGRRVIKIVPRVF